MAISLQITPTRFIASGGKLDSDKRYLFRDYTTPILQWPALLTRTGWTEAATGVLSGDLHCRIDGVLMTPTRDPGAHPAGTYTVGVGV